MALVALLSVLCWASLPSEAAAKTPLRLWSIVPPEATRTQAGMVWRSIFHDFVKAHPEIECIDASGISLSGEGAESARLLAMAAEQGADVILLNTGQVPMYADQGLICPLDDLMPEWKPFRHTSEAINEATRIDGRTYAVPAMFQLPELVGFAGLVRSVAASGTRTALIYRKDIFAEVGLEPDRPPATWEELAEYARRCTANEVEIQFGPLKGSRQHRYGFGFVLGEEAGRQFTNFVWQAGGEMLRKENGHWRVAFQEPAGVKALQFLQDLTTARFEREGEMVEGVVYAGPRQVFMNSAGAPLGVTDSFAKGMIAMIYDNPWAWRFGEQNAWGLNSRVIGVAPLPAGPNGRASAITSVCYAINRQAPPDVRRAAWEYIKYMCSRAPAELYTQLMVEVGSSGRLSPQDLADFGYKAYLSYIPEQFITIDERMKPYERVEPATPGYENIVRVELAVPLHRVMLGGPEIDPKTELEKAAHHGNLVLQGLRHEEAKGLTKWAAYAVMAVTFTLGAVILGRVARTVRAHTTGSAKKRFGVRTHVQAWVYLLPAVASVLFWAYLPLFRGLRMALFDYRLFGESSFVGLANFVSVFSQPPFWQVMWNTAYYVFLSLSLGFLAPLIMAVLLSEVPKGKYMFRTLFYLPAVVSPVVMLLMWRGLIYNPTLNGTLNMLLSHVGMGPYRWLDDPRLAMLCVVIPGIWGGAGAGSLIYIAAMTTIPVEMYEAAELDGAGIRRKFLHIMLPYLRPLLLINFIGAFVGAFQATENIFVMTEGGPANATRTVGLEIFYNAFLFLKFGYATAMAWIMGAMLMGFTLWNLKILGAVEFRKATGQV